jgi:glucose dehydrogenase
MAQSEALDSGRINRRGVANESGKELWKGTAPVAAHATPMTYVLSSNGKQYLVIAAGGHAKIEEAPLGDALVAFSLP